jgi:hypothetical protein
MGSKEELRLNPWGEVGLLSTRGGSRENPSLRFPVTENILDS